MTTNDLTGQYLSDDDAQLAAQGYVSSFKREFSNLATISFAFAIMVNQNILLNLTCHP
jgi:hypothetical protein